MPYNDLPDFFTGTNPNDSLGGGGVPQVPVASMPATPNVSLMDQTPPMRGPSGAAAQPAPPPPPYRPSMMDRIQAHLMHVPSGMQGLLSDDDLKNARDQGLLHFGLSMLANSRGVGAGNAPSLGQALASSYDQGQQAFQGGVDKSIQSTVGGMQTAQMLRILQARQQIGQQFAPKPGEDRGQAIDRLMQMFHAYAGAGDTEMLGKLSDVISKLGQDPTLFRMEHSKEPFKIDTGATTELYDPITYRHLGSIPKTGAPMSEDQKNYRDISLGMQDRQQQAQREDRLVSQFNGEVKPITDATQALQSLYTLAPRAQAGDGIAQQALMGAFVKLMHPNAIVRPGELKNYEDTKSLPDDVKLAFDHALNGTKLSAAQVQSVMGQIDRFRQQWQSRYDPILTQYKQRARQQKVDESVFFNPFESLPPVGGGSASGSTGKNPMLP